MGRQIIMDHKEQYVIYKKELVISKWVHEKLHWGKTLDMWNKLMKRLKILRGDWDDILSKRHQLKIDKKQKRLMNGIMLFFIYKK